MLPSSHEPAVRAAVIDVGTNSVKLLVADIRGHSVTPLYETSEQTRLGAGFYQTHRLEPGRIQNTADAARRFAQTAQKSGAKHLRVIATSAARDAINRNELTAALEAATGVPTEVISGEQEADWGFLGVSTSDCWAGQDLLILDVGGGSTEFILGRAGEARPEFRQSFQLGSVRLLEQFPPTDPPSAGELPALRDELAILMKQQVRPALAAVWSPSARSEPTRRSLGIGGTTAILALIHHQRVDFDRDLIEATTFPARTMSALVEQLWALPLTQRRRLPGLPPERADVILFGAAIYEAVMREFELPSLGISLRGLRYAALLRPAEGSGRQI